jgi:hypothetical protein
MTGSLARIEVRHLARSPLLWLGFALGVAFAMLNMVPWSSWPVLTRDDLIIYPSGGPLLSGGAVLAGAWLALRDRKTGAADLVAVTPTAPWRLWWARLSSVAVAAAGVFAVAFVLGLAFSVVRGGRGVSDLRLLADGALMVVLSGWVGVAVGRLSGSRMVSLLATPIWVVFCLVVGTWSGMAGTESSLQRLSPLLALADRSAEFGFLPDPLWPHLGYLLGLVLLAAVGLLALVARGSGQPPPLGSVLAVCLAGVVLVGAGGTGVVMLPPRLVVLGPDRADWKPLSEVEAIVTDPSWTYPDDGRARSCARDSTLEVCVYPAYGQRLARHTLRSMQPVARLFSGLPDVPTRVRMVPGQRFEAPGQQLVQNSCRGTEVQMGEAQARSGTGRASRFDYGVLYLGCALRPAGGDRSTESLGAVQLWALQASGTITTEELRRAAEGDPIPELMMIPASPAMTTAALAMADLPADQVRAELTPGWERLRAGQLPLSELPGQRP